MQACTCGSISLLRLILNRWCRRLCTRSMELHLYIAIRQDMTLAPTCAAHYRALCDIGCARVAVARDDDGTDKCNFRACLHGIRFPGVLEKVPWVYPFFLSTLARATAGAMNLMYQICPDVNMTV